MHVARLVSLDRIVRVGFIPQTTSVILLFSNVKGYVPTLMIPQWDKTVLALMFVYE